MRRYNRKKRYNTIEKKHGSEYQSRDKLRVFSMFSGEDDFGSEIESGSENESGIEVSCRKSVMGDWLRNGEEWLPAVAFHLYHNPSP